MKLGWSFAVCKIGPTGLNPIWLSGSNCRIRAGTDQIVESPNKGGFWVGDFKQSGSYFYYYLLRTYFRTAVWKRVSSRKVITKQRECKSDAIFSNPILRASLKQLVVVAADLWRAAC